MYSIEKSEQQKMSKKCGFWVKHLGWFLKLWSIWWFQCQKLLNHGRRLLKMIFFAIGNPSKIIKKSKKTPVSTIGFLTYWTHKIVILGQKRPKWRFLIDSSLMGGEQSKVIFDKYLIRLKSLILMNASHNYTDRST